MILMLSFGGRASDATGCHTGPEPATVSLFDFGDRLQLLQQEDSCLKIVSEIPPSWSQLPIRDKIGSRHFEMSRWLK